MRIVLSVLALLALSSSTFAHGGGLDGNGCTMTGNTADITVTADVHGSWW